VYTVDEGKEEEEEGLFKANTVNEEEGAEEEEEKRGLGLMLKTVQTQDVCFQMSE
jgi:hypothetical protein